MFALDIQVFVCLPIETQTGCLVEDDYAIFIETILAWRHRDALQQLINQSPVSHRFPTTWHHGRLSAA